VTVSGAALVEEALAQPHQPVPEVSAQQTNLLQGHTAQAGESSAAAMEEQADFSELEWDIPFDPPEMNIAFQDLENMLMGDDFFEFTFDEEEDGGFEEERGF
jgi:hypothetical protein